MTNQDQLEKNIRKIFSDAEDPIAEVDVDNYLVSNGYDPIAIEEKYSLFAAQVVAKKKKKWLSMPVPESDKTAKAIQAKRLEMPNDRSSILKRIHDLINVPGLNVNMGFRNQEELTIEDLQDRLAELLVLKDKYDAEND